MVAEREGRPTKLLQVARRRSFGCEPAWAGRRGTRARRLVWTPFCPLFLPMKAHGARGIGLKVNQAV